MLLSMRVENWKSFKNEAVFSMTASRERVSAETVSALPAMYRSQKLLPLAAVYGANASGKTTFLSALAMMKKLVVEGVGVNRVIPVEGYRLSASRRRLPTRLALEILVDETVYLYSLALTPGFVEAESLSVRKSRGMHEVFSRSGDAIEFGRGFDDGRHRFIAEGTRPNQLFLHNAVSQNAGAFLPVYHWFSDTLEVIGMETQYEHYSKMVLRDDFASFVNDKLRRYNTGIARLILQDVQRESLPLPGGIVEDIVASATANGTMNIQLRVNTPETGMEIFILGVEDGVWVKTHKVRTSHAMEDGGECAFELAEESHGTRRLIELLAAFFDLHSANEPDRANGKVYVIDELDRGFHTEVTLDLLRCFLKSCGPTSRSQLVFTTHDLLLMDERGMRKDEMWVCEKSLKDGSTLSCLGRHPGVRTDTDLMRRYRDGVLGGYPRFYGASCSAAAPKDSERKAMPQVLNTI